MATTRIKDLSKTATTLAADSNFVLDGSTNGTQKITTGNVKADIATSFAGDLSTYGIATLGSDNKLNPDQLPDSVTNGINFVGTADSGSDLTSTTQGDFYIVNTAFTHLSISYAVGDSAVYNGSAYVKVTPGTTQIGEGGTGASTLDGAKANLEIPDVGSAANEVSLNGMLGDMAFQSSDSVSVAELQVESTTGTATTQALTVTDGTDTNFVVQEDGSVGINNSAPSDQFAGANNLVIGPNSGDNGMTICCGSSNEGKIFFAQGASGADEYRGQIKYSTASNSLTFATNAAARWVINSSGDFVSQGGGIDFGAVAEGSGTPVTNGGLLDDYESGTLTATLTPSGTGTITVDSSTNTLRYIKVGNLVTVTGKIGVSSVSSPSGSYVYLNLPFTVGSATGNRTAGTVLISAAASNANTYGVFVPNAGSTAYICSTDGTSLGAGTTGQDFSGNEELHINISYIAA